MSAPEAAAVAGVSYRQLDYWTRKGWVAPAQRDRVSPGRVVRRYGMAQVLQCAALAHLGRAGLDVAAYGPRVGGLRLGPDDLVVAGPGDQLEVVPAGRLRAHVTRPGRFVVFDPRPLLSGGRGQEGEAGAGGDEVARRTA